MSEEILSVTQFARKIGSTRGVVLDLIRNGKILAFRLSDAPKSRWRIRASEIDRLISLQLHRKYGSR